MVDEGGELSVQISTSELDVDGLIATFDGTPEFQNGLREARILIVPTDLRPEYQGPVFPITTPEVLGFLRENLGGKVLVDAAIADEDYIEFEYRSETMILPVIFVAEYGLLPLVVSLLRSYIFDRLKNRRVPQSEAIVKSQVHYVDSSGGKLFLEYEGPADTYERVVLEQINRLDPHPNQEGSQSNNE